MCALADAGVKLLPRTLNEIGMDNESQAVDRAIAKLQQKYLFKNGDRHLQVRSLIPVSSRRPVKADRWTKKKACIIGEDIFGNLFLRVCDGTVRFWDHEKLEDEIIASSVRKFLYSLGAPSDPGNVERFRA